MAGSKSDYLEKAILDYLLGGVALGAPTTVYVALSTAGYSDAATGSAMTEVTGGNYSRVAVPNNLSQWPAATNTSPGATKQNGQPITFPAANAQWGTSVTSFYLVDAVNGGNVLYGGDLSVPKTIASGDTATFAANSITITED